MKVIINIILIGLFLFSLKFFTYTNIDPELYGKWFKILIWGLLGYLTLNNKRIISEKYNYISFNNVGILCLWPIITAISCYLEHGQSIFDSINSGLPHCILFIYFFCILNKVAPKTIIRLIIIAAIIRTGITIIQQYTFPHILFSMRSGLEGANSGEITEDIRSGIYRFLIADAYYLPLFVGFYAYEKFLLRRKRKYILLFFVACYALYLDQSRQVIAAFIGSLFVVPLLNHGNKMRYFIITLICAFVLYYNFDSLFGELQSQTSEDLNESNIRLFAYAYYWENTGSIISFIFGNGFSGSSEYGNTIQDMQEAGLWRVDIGVVGAIHLMGLGFVLIFLFYYWETIIRKWKSIDMSLKLMFSSIVFQLPLIFPIYNTSLPGYECFMAFIFYLTDKSIAKNSIKVGLYKLPPKV